MEKSEVVFWKRLIFGNRGFGLSLLKLAETSQNTAPWCDCERGNADEILSDKTELCFLRVWLDTSHLGLEMSF